MSQEVLEWIGGKNDEVARKGVGCPVEGSQWYLLSAHWFNLWNRGSYSPGQPIDNSSLIHTDTEFLTLPGEVVLHSGMRKYRDFIPVPPKAWEYFTKNYVVPTGHTILRKSISIGNRRTDVEVNYPKLQLVFAWAENKKVEEGAKSVQISQQATVAKLLKKIAKVKGVAFDSKCWRLWQLNAGTSVKKIALSEEMSGTLLVKERKIGELSLKSSSKFVCENRTHAVPWMFRGPKPLRCAFCENKIEEYSISCSCQKKVYCSSECSEEGAIFHTCLKDLTTNANGDCTVRSNGIANLGNTCYMNSGIQSLASCSALMEYFLQDKHWEDLITTSSYLQNLVRDFGVLLKDLWESRESPVYPWGFKDALDRHAPQFTGVSQHDCHEFLVSVLDGLHISLTKPASSLLPEDSTAAEYCWSKYLHKNHSIIQELMHGQLKAHRCCYSCGGQSEAFEPFAIVSMAIPNLCRKLYNPLFVDRSGKVHQLSFLRDTYVTALELKDSVKQLMEVEHVLVVYYSKNMVSEVLSDQDEVSDKASIAVYEVEQGVMPVFLHFEVNEQCFTLPRVVLASFADSLEDLTSKIKPFVRTLLGDVEEFSIKLSEDRGGLGPRTSFKAYAELPESGTAGSLRGEDWLFLGLLWASVERIVIQQSNDIHVHPQSFETNMEFRRTFQSSISIGDCLKHFQDEEPLENHSECFRCKSSSQTTRKLAFERLPPVLIFHLKRFVKLDAKFKKNDQLIEFSESLDMSEFIHAPAEYQLLSVINHVGSMDFGHYFTYSKHPSTDTWYLYEDELAEPLRSPLVTPQAYILFYTRVS